MIKLVAFDLDGTLLDEEKQLPPNFYQIAERLLDHGVRVVIASGRQYQNLYEQFAPLADRFSYLSENGAFFFEDGKCSRFTFFEEFWEGICYIGRFGRSPRRVCRCYRLRSAASA